MSHVVDLPVMCTRCGHAYWLTLGPTPFGLTWELEEKDGDGLWEGVGEAACPLCGGPLGEDLLAPLEDPPGG